MIIYIIALFIDYEGFLEPEFGFWSKSKAELKCKELNDLKKYDSEHYEVSKHYEVLEVDIR